MLHESNYNLCKLVTIQPPPNHCDLHCSNLFACGFLNLGLVMFFASDKVNPFQFSSTIRTLCVVLYLTVLRVCGTVQDADRCLDLFRVFR